MNIRKVLLGICLITGISNLFGQSFTIYKDDGRYICIDSNKKEVNNGTSAISVIQFAIDRCAENGGGDVLMSKGVYPLNTPIRLMENVWLHGKRRGTELQLLKPNSTCVEMVDTKNTRISELTITTGDNGNSLAGLFGENTQNGKVEEVFFLGFSNAGISLTGNNSGLIIDQCIFMDNDQAHILLENIGNQTAPIIISKGTFFKGGYGIKTVNGGNGLRIEDNMFAYLKGSTVDVDIDSVSIEGNRVYWCESDGMRIKSNGFIMSGNIDSWTRGHALVLDGAENGTIMTNNFIDLGVRFRDGLRKCGIAIYHSNHVAITGNSIWNFGDQGPLEYAIYEDKKSGNNTITYNTGWFHEYENAVKSLGKNSIVKNNTSNKGEYRGDYWDYNEKFRRTVEKYLESLYIAGDRNPDPEPESQSLSLQGEKLVECKDMFQQVLSIKEGGIRKFGWNGADNQLWTFEKRGEAYLILNKESGLALQCEGSGNNTTLALMKRGKKDAQLWKLLSVGNGYYKIESLLNGKVLEASGLDNYDWKKNRVRYQGQPVRLSDYRGEEGQQWRFIDPLPLYTYNDVIQN